MARLFNWFIGQLVTQADMRAGDVALEKGDRDLLIDLDMCGIIDGFEVTAQTPAAMAVDVAVGLTHAANGARVQSYVPASVSLLYDHDLVPTLVLNAGQSRIISVFAVQSRLGSDPRLDATNTTVYYRQDESCAFVVVAGNESAGTPTPPAFIPDGCLIADITRAYGQSTITSGNISIARRQDKVKLTGSPFGMSGTGGIYGTTKEAIQAIVSRYNGLINGTGDTLASASVPYGGSGTWYGAIAGIAAGTVESAIDAVVAALASSTTGSAGANRIGVPADTTTVGTVAASSLNTRLIALRDADIGIYDGTSAVWTNSVVFGGNTVEGAITTIVLDLASISVGGRGTGGQKIGMSVLGNFSTTSVHGYFAELVAVTSGNDGAKRIGATAAGGFVGLTVRAQLDELRVGGTFTGAVTVTGATVCSSTLGVTGAATLSSTLSVVGAATFPDITATGTSHYKLASRAVIRAQSTPMYIKDTGLAVPFNTSCPPGVFVEQALDLPDGALLTGLDFRIDPLTHASLSGLTLPSLSLKKVAIATGATTFIGSTVNDGSVNEVAYSLAHDLSMTGLSETVDRETYVYLVEFTAEAGGANEAVCILLGSRVVLTITRLADA